MRFESHVEHGLRTSAHRGRRSRRTLTPGPSAGLRTNAHLQVSVTYCDFVTGRLPDVLRIPVLAREFVGAGLRCPLRVPRRSRCPALRTAVAAVLASAKRGLRRPGQDGPRVARPLLGLASHGQDAQVATDAGARARSLAGHHQLCRSAGRGVQTGVPDAPREVIRGPGNRLAQARRRLFNQKTRPAHPATH